MIRSVDQYPIRVIYLVYVAGKVEKKLYQFQLTRTDVHLIEFLKKWNTTLLNLILRRCYHDDIIKLKIFRTLIYTKLFYYVFWVKCVVSTCVSGTSYLKIKIKKCVPTCAIKLISLDSGCSKRLIERGSTFSWYIWKISCPKISYLNFSFLSF